MVVMIIYNYDIEHIVAIFYNNISSFSVTDDYCLLLFVIVCLI